MLCWYLLTFTIYNDSQTWHLDRKCIDICRLFDILHINLVIRIIEVNIHPPRKIINKKMFIQNSFNTIQV